MRDRVEVGDAQRVRDQRTGGRTTAGTDPDAVVLGPHDEVGDHEEVAREAHLDDDRQLVLDPGAVLLVDAAGEAALHALPDLLPEVLLLRHPLGDRVGRHEVVVGEEALGVDLLGHQQRVAAALLPDVGGVDRPHLVGRLDVVAAAVEPEPVGVAELLARLDAQEGVVTGGVRLVRVVGVVGDHRRDVQLAADPDQAVADPALDVEPVVHDLQEVVLLAEDLLVFRGGLERLVVLAEPQPGLHLPGRAAGRGHQAVGVLGEDVGVHPGPLADEALGVGTRAELHQVLQAGLVPRPDGHVGVVATRRDVVALLVRLAPQHRLLVHARLGRDVRLDAEDGLHPGAGRLLVEVVGAVHVAMVGDRDRGHLQLAHEFEHLLQPRRSVEHRILGVDVQMNKRITHETPIVTGPRTRAYAVIANQWDSGETEFISVPRRRASPPTGAARPRSRRS